MNPKDDLLSDTMLMHQMEAFALLEEYRIIAEEEKENARQQEHTIPEVNISFEHVDNYPCDTGILWFNYDTHVEEALDIIKNISLEELMGLMELDHLSPEDAGGKYLLNTRDVFHSYVLKAVKADPTASYYENPQRLAGGISIHYGLLGLDESDVLDILFSIYGEEEAENSIHPHRNIVTFSEKMMDLLWQHADGKTSSSHLYKTTV